MLAVQGDYDQAISCLEKAIEEYYPDRTKLKFDGADERLACAKVSVFLTSALWGHNHPREI